MGEHQEAPMRIIETVMASNEARKRSMARKVAASCNGALRGKTIAILGLTFKADTDDMRDAVLAQALTDAGSILKAYDPVANGGAGDLLPSSVQYCSSAHEAAKGADAIVIATEWQEFAEMDSKKPRAVVRAPIVIDLRNLLSEETVKQSDFIYCFIGGPRRHAFETASPQLDPKRPLLETARKTTDSDDLLEDSQRPSSARDRTGF
jgi:UDPglucose 6-dehydrogenase